MIQRQMIVIVSVCKLFKCYYIANIFNLKFPKSTRFDLIIICLYINLGFMFYLCQ